jgi:hypothetical protein
VLHVDDAAFVRAPAPLVYRRLVDLDAWPAFGLARRVRPAPPVDGAPVWLVETTGAVGRRQRWSLRVHRWRPDRGLKAEVEGDLCGRFEFWLEATHGGTVVHHVLSATTPLARPDRVLRDHRRAVRRGLWGLKDTLHLEARTSAGLTA